MFRSMESSRCCRSEEEEMKRIGILMTITGLALAISIFTAICVKVQVEIVEMPDVIPNSNMMIVSSFFPRHLFLASAVASVLLTAGITMIGLAGWRGNWRGNPK